MPHDPTTTVEAMTQADWQRVRSIRLRALAESPDAFERTHAEEAQRPPDLWRSRLASTDGVTLLAQRDNVDLGLVTCAPYGDHSGLFGMWVDPAARQLGIGSALVDAVLTWAREQGATRVLLDVADLNAPAIALYERKGFLPTGQRGSLSPPRDHIREHQRACVLSREP